MTCGDDGEPEPIQKLQDLVNKYVLISKFQTKKSKVFILIL